MQVNNNSLAKFISRRRWIRRLGWFELPEKVYINWNNRPLYVTPNDWNGPSYHVLKQGPETYETENIGFLKNVIAKLPSDATFFDIGANAGVFSFAIASEFSKLHIHSFEPGPTLFKCLSATFTDKNFPNVKTHRLAVSDTRSTATLFGDKKNHGGHSLVKEQITSDIEAEHQVETTTIDNFIQENSINSLDVIKMDIQGHEGAALKGGALSIQKHRPIVLIECFKDELTSASSPILSPFINEKYMAFVPSANKMLEINVDEFSPILGNYDHYLDVAFVPKEKTELIPHL